MKKKKQNDKSIEIIRLCNRIQTISYKAKMWRERYEIQSFWTILSVICNIVLLMIMLS